MQNTPGSTASHVKLTVETCFCMGRIKKHYTEAKWPQTTTTGRLLLRVGPPPNSHTFKQIIVWLLFWELPWHCGGSDHANRGTEQKTKRVTKGETRKQLRLKTGLGGKAVVLRRQHRELAIAFVVGGKMKIALVDTAGAGVRPTPRPPSFPLGRGTEPSTQGVTASHVKQKHTRKTCFCMGGSRYITTNLCDPKQQPDDYFCVWVDPEFLHLKENQRVVAVLGAALALWRK